MTALAVDARPLLWLLSAMRRDGEATHRGAEPITADVRQLVVHLFAEEGTALLRLARLFVDDRDAAEDIVQEAFLRLARHGARIEAAEKAPAYLRSIVLNLARDHNRRGLVSLRHQQARGRDVDVSDDTGDGLVRREDSRCVVEAVRRLPQRQRDCVTLRYLEDRGVDEIAAVLRLSPNSVKTHLRRALAALDGMLAP